MADAGTALREGYAKVGDVELHYVEAGHGPPVVPLHGFPEIWYGWRQQIAPLVSAGFRVVAPDLRGYNLSSRPDGVASYTADKLADDIRGLIHRRQRRNPGVTEITKMPNPGHSLTIDHVWREVAQTALSFVQRFVPAKVR
jgi:alpha-beta hydrolase superfamily lysophospholipase